jgi:uncharacterized protein YjbI with pentapeptide repeats
MVDNGQVNILFKGFHYWNVWRKRHPRVRPNLVEADLSNRVLTNFNLSQSNLQHSNLSKAFLRRANLIRCDLRGANLNRAELSGATLVKANLIQANLNRCNLSNTDLSGAKLMDADLIGAFLQEANLSGADLSQAKLSKARLTGANLTRARFSNADIKNANLTRTNLRRTDFTDADLTEVDFTRADFVEVNLTRAKLNGSRIYGISAWDIHLEDTEQSNLIITPHGHPDITLDNLKIAQLVYLLIDNPEIREVIDTISSKVVLVLGRFTPLRKAVLEIIRQELRRRNYIPVIFDFDGPLSRDVTETVATLAHISRFIIADITEARSIPQELMAIVPHLPSVPVQPLLESSYSEYGMFEHFRNYPWVLSTFNYADPDDVIANINDKIILPAEVKLAEHKRDRATSVA